MRGDGKPTRIDVHHHYLPDFYVRALDRAGRLPPDGMPATPAWSEQVALDTMDRLGIAKAYLSISSPGVHFGDDRAAHRLARRCNDEGARLKRAHPERFGFFACTSLPDVRSALAEIRRAFDELDADGIVFETNFHGTYLGDGALASLYAELDRRAAVLFVHPTTSSCGCPISRGPDLGYPPPMLEFMFDTTRAITHLILTGTLSRHPRIRVVVPHGGAALPVLAGRIALFSRFMHRSGGEAPPDIRAALHRCHYELAGAAVPELLGSLLEIADPTKLHYGSDWPFTPVDICERLALELDRTPLLDGTLGEAIMQGNAERLFHRALEIDGGAGGSG